MESKAKVLARLLLAEKPNSISENGEEIKATGYSVLLLNGDISAWIDEYENCKYEDTKETVQLTERKRKSEGTILYDWYDENGIAVCFGVQDGRCVLTPVAKEVA